MKKTFKILRNVSAGIVLFFVLLFFLLTTGALNPAIKRGICMVANNQIHGEVSINKLSGNVFSDFSIDSLQISDDQHAIITFAKLKVSYAFTDLLHHRINVDTILLESPLFYFTEGADSLWNIQNLIPTSASTSNDAVPSKWNITVKDLIIMKLESEVYPLDTTLSIPEKVKCNLNLNFAYSSDKLEMDVRHFNLETQNPVFQITEMYMETRMIDSVFYWTDFVLKLGQSRFTSSGFLPLGQPERGALSLKAEPFDSEDFKPWLSEVYGRADLDVTLERQNDSSTLNLSLDQGVQNLKLVAQLWNFESIPKYRISANLDSLDMAYWTHKADLKSLITGTIAMVGEGFDIKRNSLQLDGDLVDFCKVYRPSSQLSFSFQKNQESVDVNISGRTVFGDIASSIQLTHIFSIPEYAGNLKLKHVNLAKLSTNPLMESDLNMLLRVKGTEFKLGKMRSSISLYTDESVIFAQPLSGMIASIDIKKDSYSLKGLHVKTPYLQASIDGSGNLADKNGLKFSIKLQNIQDLLISLGQEPFLFNGGMSGSVSGPIDNLNFNANLVIDEMDMDTVQINSLQTHIQSFFSYGKPNARTKRGYAINDISSLTLETISIKTSSVIDQFIYKDHILNNIKLELEKDQGTLTGETFVQAFSGSLETNFKVINTFSIPEYSLQASLNQFDLAQLTKNDSLYSSINLELLVKGKSVNIDSVDVEVQIVSKGSEVFGSPVERIDSKIIYKQGYYWIDNLVINSPFVDAEVAGEGDIAAENQLNFQLNCKDINKLRFNVIPENIDFTGQISGSVLGTRDSLNVTSHINLDDFEMDTIKVENLLVDALLEIRDTDYSGFLQVDLLNSRIQNLGFETIQFASDFSQDSAENSFTYYSSDSLNGNVNTTLLMGAIPTLHFNEIALNFAQDSWLGGSDSTYISFGSDSIVINALDVSSQDGSLNANGLLSFNGNENLKIEVSNMDIRKIKGIQLLPVPIAGNLNAGLTIEGTSRYPLINSFLTIEDPLVDTLQFKKMGLTMTYADAEFNLESFVYEQHSNLMHVSMALPYRLSFDDTIALPSDDTPLKASLDINHFDLARVTPYLSLAESEMQGFLNVNIQLENTIKQPIINGDVNIREGDFKYTPLGMYYNTISLESKIRNNAFQLDSFTLLSTKGKLQFKGLVEIDSLFQREIETIDLSMKGTNFKLFDSDMASALINTNLDIKGTPEQPVFKGNLSVLKSSFNVDLFLKKYNRVYDNSEQPLLLLARSKNKLPLDMPETIKDSIISPNIFKNLKGTFDIEFPRNTWIKGKNMNFELFGTVKAIKEGDLIDLFGSLDVKRGYYKLYGRRLDFESGEVIFTGGSAINPKLNLNMAYTFRDPDNMLRILNIIVSDRLDKPTITFFIDDLSIEEKEAISYLLFNKSSNQLDTKENSTLNDNNNNVDLILNQISGVIKDALQSKLGLDVLEISGNSGWSQSTVSTGKYLTNNIYLNYERTFSIDKKDKVIQPQKITLEYQIYRSFFIQATNQNTNSGFDFIIKWTRK